MRKDVEGRVEKREDAASGRVFRDRLVKKQPQSKA